MNWLHQARAHPYRYKLHKSMTTKTPPKIIVETHDGDVARLIQADGKPTHS